jgi:hypothetical protein
MSLQFSLIHNTPREYHPSMLPQSQFQPYIPQSQYTKRMSPQLEPVNIEKIYNFKIN